MRKIGASIVGIIFGVLLMVGLYAYLVEAGSFKATSKLGLAFPIAGVILGILAGFMGGFRKKKNSG